MSTALCSYVTILYDIRCDGHGIIRVGSYIIIRIICVLFYYYTLYYTITDYNNKVYTEQLPLQGERF